MECYGREIQRIPQTDGEGEEAVGTDTTPDVSGVVRGKRISIAGARESPRSRLRDPMLEAK